MRQRFISYSTVTDPNRNREQNEIHTKKEIAKSAFKSM